MSKLKQKMCSQLKTAESRLSAKLHDSLMWDLNRSLFIPPVIYDEWVQAAEFKVRYQRENLLSKLNDPEQTSPEQRKQAAIEKWLLMNRRNATTNTRLLIDECDFGPFTSRKLFRVTRRIVKGLIGETPSADILQGVFTNGASTRIKRSPVAISAKFVGQAHATSSAWELFTAFVVSGSPAWRQHFYSGLIGHEEVSASVMFTVPKSSIIDRVACKEPEINMYLQRGVGNYLRAVLKSKAGIDLNDQSVNRDMSRLASLPNSGYATLDLSSASDLISTQLVYDLLPLDWFRLLDSIRVSTTLIDDEPCEMHMFSTMGNGFTFELESLIFHSLCRAVAYLTGTDGRIYCYGDDLIVQTSLVGLISKVFDWCGFILNRKKTHSSGAFRESCGGHYYNGYDVTPFFVREKVTTISQLIHFLNSLRRWATNDDLMLHFFPGSPLQRVWRKYSALIPSFLYGGRDLESRTALFTPHHPRWELVPKRKAVRGVDSGAYLQWLHAAGERVNPLVTSSGFLEGEFTLRPGRIWSTDLPEFPLWHFEQK